MTSITCCECAVAVGSSGPARAALLLPCQHVLHLRCVEYLQRQRQLRLESRWKGKHITPKQGCLFNRFLCPGCGVSVNDIIPLFLGEQDVAKSPSEANENEENEEDGSSTGVEKKKSLEEEMECVFAVQQQNLKTMHELNREKIRVEELTRACALLHHEQSMLQEKLEKCLSALPPVSFLATASSSSLSSLPSTSLDKHSAQELQAYLAHGSPLLFTTQKELRKIKREKEQKRKKVEKLKAQYLKLRRRLPSRATTGTNGVSNMGHVGVATRDLERARLKAKLSRAGWQGAGSPCSSPPSNSPPRLAATPGSAGHAGAATHPDVPVPAQETNIFAVTETGTAELDDANPWGVTTARWPAAPSRSSTYGPTASDVIVEEGGDDDDDDVLLAPVLLDTAGGEQALETPLESEPQSRKRIRPIEVDGQLDQQRRQRLVHVPAEDEDASGNDAVAAVVVDSESSEDDGDEVVYLIDDEESAPNPQPIHRVRPTSPQSGGCSEQDQKGSRGRHLARRTTSTGVSGRTVHSSSTSSSSSTASPVVEASAGEGDVVYIDVEEAGGAAGEGIRFLSQDAHCPVRGNPSSSRGLKPDYVDKRLVIVERAQAPIPNNEDEDEDDLGNDRDHEDGWAAHGLLPPLARSQAIGRHESAKPRVSDLQRLPRREDYLWQTDLLSVM